MCGFQSLRVSVWEGGGVLHARGRGGCFFSSVTYMVYMVVLNHLTSKLTFGLASKEVTRHI